MLESSQDILFYVLAICAIALTAFFCWLFYYFISIVKNAYDLTKSLRKKMEVIDDILITIKSHVHSTANYIGIIVNGVERIVKYVSHRQNEQSKTSKNKKETS